MAINKLAHMGLKGGGSFGRLGIPIAARQITGNSKEHAGQPASCPAGQRLLTRRELAVEDRLDLCEVVLPRDPSRLGDMPGRFRVIPQSALGASQHDKELWGLPVLDSDGTAEMP